MGRPFWDAPRGSCSVPERGSSSMVRGLIQACVGSLWGTRPSAPQQLAPGHLYTTEAPPPATMVQILPMGFSKVSFKACPAFRRPDLRCRLPGDQRATGGLWGHPFHQAADPRTPSLSPGAVGKRASVVLTGSRRRVVWGPSWAWDKMGCCL